MRIKEMQSCNLLPDLVRCSQLSYINRTLKCARLEYFFSLMYVDVESNKIASLIMKSFTKDYEKLICLKIILLPINLVSFFILMRNFLGFLKVSSSKLHTHFN